MNSINAGDDVYVPFWVLLDYYDNTPPDPFIKCNVINIYSKSMTGPTGDTNIMCVDLNLGKPDLFANAVPVDYAITELELPEWRQKIADWFLAYKP